MRSEQLTTNLANPSPQKVHFRLSDTSPSSNKKQDKMSTFEQVVSLTSDPIYPIFRHSRSNQIHCDDRIPKYMGANRAERMEADGAYCRSPSMARAISSVVSPRPLLSSSSRDRRSLSFAARPSTSLESSSALSVRCTQTHSADECEEGAGSLENRIQKRKGHAKACVCSNIYRDWSPRESTANILAVQ